VFNYREVLAPRRLVPENFSSPNHGWLTQTIINLYYSLLRLAG